MEMPLPFQMLEYSQNIAEVPSDLLHLQDLDYWSYSEEATAHSPLKPQVNSHCPGHVPVLISEPAGAASEIGERKSTKSMV